MRKITVRRQPPIAIRSGQRRRELGRSPTQRENNICWPKKEYLGDFSGHLKIRRTLAQQDPAEVPVPDRDVLLGPELRLLYHDQ